MKTTPDIATAAAALIRVGAIELRTAAEQYYAIGELEATQRCQLLAQATEEAAAFLRATYPFPKEVAGA